MNKCLILSVIFFFSLTNCTYQELTDKLDTYIKSFQDFSGAILITYKDKLIIKKAYGLVNYEHEIPNTEHSKFRIASLSKSFTAAAILILHEKNMLKVSDKISAYIPNYPNGDQITVHHLFDTYSRNSKLL